MASPVDYVTIGVRCSGNPPIGLLGKTKYAIAALTAGNFAASTSAADALKAATVALTTGVISSEDISLARASDAAYPSGTANRGNKWILSASNADGRKFTYTIPAAADTGNVEADNLTADLTSTAWAAYKIAFEDVCLDPAANALTLDGAKLGGRRR